VRRAWWWVVPLTIVWALGMWLQVLQVRVGGPVWAVVLVVLGGMVSFGVGVFIGVRRAEVRVGQLFTLATAGFAVSAHVVNVVTDLLPAWSVTPILAVGSVLSPVALASVCWVVALFPDGRHPSPRWRWLSWYLGVFVVVFTPVYAGNFLGWQSPDSFPALFQISAVFEVTFSFVMVALIGALGSLFVRFRHGSREVRAQLGWLLWAVATYVVFLLVGFSQVAGEFDRIDPLVATAVDAIPYSLIPISMAIAIFRYRLYEIDRVVSRTVSYASVVAVLGATYLGLVVALRGLLPVEGDLPVAVSTLAVASLFLPLIRRVQRVVDRRFFRSRYDAGVVVARVADELRGSLDIAEVTGRVGSVVDEVFAPVTVGVWVSEASS